MGASLYFFLLTTNDFIKLFLNKKIQNDINHVFLSIEHLEKIGAL